VREIMWERVAACCSALQCVAVLKAAKRETMRECVAVCCSML